MTVNLNLNRMVPSKDLVSSGSNTNSEIAWYKLNTEDTLEKLKSNENGLNEIEVVERLEEHGENIIESTNQLSILKLLFDQVNNFLIILLLFAVAVSALIGHMFDAIAILIIVIFSIILGFVQEYKADKAIESLQQMTAPTARVSRDGEIVEIPSRGVVPGDILILKMGDKVPADSRIIESSNLQTDEASLTGESLSIIKFSAEINSDNLSIGDRKNMVYAGTVITYGRCRAVVTGTGMKTEFGKIATELSSIQATQTPLQKNIDHMGKILSIASIFAISIVFTIGVLQDHDPVEMFIWSIAVAVAVVPEALPAVITISLAMGVQKMSKKNALVRKLTAVETLGATSIIFTDKTGTLTEGKMSVKEVYMGLDRVSESDLAKDNNNDNLLLQGMSLCNDAILNVDKFIGNPTDIGLREFSEKFGYGKTFIAQKPRMAEIPFSSDRKMMTTAHSNGSKNILFTKGAPEKIIKNSKRILINGNIESLDNEIKNDLIEIINKMTNNSLRTLGIAYKILDKNTVMSEDNLVFLGFIGLMDPPRSGVKESIKDCHDAGIKVIMLTGDHLSTARSIGTDIGIVNNGLVISGLDLDKMSDEELRNNIRNIDVIARVSPFHKLRVVDVIKNDQQIIAMTGDGINDAPALKSANVGIAMGITGTDVSKEASDMVLADDNFNTIVEAIYEGRIIFDNIKKYLMFLLSSNLGEIILLSLAVMLGMELPLIAIQILYVNLATDGLPALALAVDPPIYSKLNDPPRDPHKSIFSKPVMILIIIGGVWSAALNLTIFYYFYYVKGISLADAQGLVFINLILIQFVKAYNYRSDKHSIFSFKPFSNKWLNRAVIWEFILLIFIIYLPGAQSIMSTHALDLTEWIIIAISSLSVLPIIELGKWLMVRKYYPNLPSMESVKSMI
ncbi:MAG: cation-translocating P-type ATPase [Candidatus Heimdallarchaeota archaeon]|nr:cation-translocating P-type ATPase [Candidatus Heimdallarchaeota archaeon]